MPTYVEDAYTQIADVIAEVIEEEFSDLDYLQVHHDRIHESLGADSICHVGISPDDVTPRGRGTQETSATIQFYAPYHLDVEPFQEVDPRIVTNYAERLTRVLARARVTGTRESWYFSIGTVRFVPDPTGNKSRFEMTVTAVGDNMGIMETIG